MRLMLLHSMNCGCISPCICHKLLLETLQPGHCMTINNSPQTTLHSINNAAVFTLSVHHTPILANTVNSTYPSQTQGHFKTESEQQRPAATLLHLGPTTPNQCHICSTAGTQHQRSCSAVHYFLPELAFLSPADWARAANEPLPVSWPPVAWLDCTRCESPLVIGVPAPQSLVTAVSDHGPLRFEPNTTACSVARPPFCSSPVGKAELPRSSCAEYRARWACKGPAIRRTICHRQQPSSLNSQTADAWIAPRT